MANTFSPFGFRSFGRRDGGSVTMGMETRYMLSSDANPVFTGDPVANSSTYLGYVSIPSSGTAAGLAGIFNGCEYYDPDQNRVTFSKHFPGNVSSSSPVKAFLITDPEMQFVVQCSTAAVIGTSVIGWNAGYASSNSSTGNTTTGLSVVALQSTSVSANSSLPFRIVATSTSIYPPGINGTDATVAGVHVVVVPNNWDRKSLTALTT